jgi:hypothetical protein
METAVDPPPPPRLHPHLLQPPKPNPEQQQAKPNQDPGKSNQFLKPKFPNATKISVGEDTYTIGRRNFFTFIMSLYKSIHC